MPHLLLGPLLRYADESCATLWVETDRACTVTVTGEFPTTSGRTFHANGHHYALVVVEGLPAGAVLPYRVHLDDEQVWPEPGSTFPPSVLRTAGGDRHFSLAFGSCRVAAPHHPPYTERARGNPQGSGVDALQAIALRMTRLPVENWPDALLMVGDQVYADEVSPQTRDFIRARRDTSRPPGEEVADFEEYTQLYRESWSQPTIRWLLSVVPTLMIFDDHDVRDDWNTSEAWRRWIEAQPWWDDRIAGGLATYWIYQHLGNLSPAELATDELYAAVRGDDDAGPRLREFALRADRGRGSAESVRWSYCRDFGGTRLVVVDSRSGRVLREDARQMVDDAEWQWVREHATGDVDHLFIATSLPVLLPRAIHDLESWNEAVCRGAWGRRWARWGERLRQGVDLEHWAAFRASFDRMIELVGEVGSGRRGEPPASIVLLSGDVHFAYLAEAHLRDRPEMRSRVFQAVCSPFRNALQWQVQAGDRFARTRVGATVGRTLARAAGVAMPAVDWRVDHGPWFDNEVATIDIDARQAFLTMERAAPGDGSDPRLQIVSAFRLTDGDPRRAG